MAPHALNFCCCCYMQEESCRTGAALAGLAEQSQIRCVLELGDDAGEAPPLQLAQALLTRQQTCCTQHLRCLT